MDSIHFDLNHAAILILLALPIVWGFWSLYNYRKERLQAFAEPSVLKKTIIERVRGIFSVQVCLYVVAWIFGVLALMQPKGNERYLTNGQIKQESEVSPQELRQKHHLVIFLIDVSASMSIKDNMTKGTRLDIAKEISDDVISSLQGESVALFAFTGNTMQVVPFTMDYMFTRLMLDELKINEGETSGTDIKSALETILKNRFVSTSDSNKTFIIMTDGGDTSLFNLKENQLFDGINNIIKPLKGADRIHLKTLIVGTGALTPSDVPNVSFQGKPVSSKLELPLLRRMSSVGNGQLWQTHETSTIDISDGIASMIQKDTSYANTSNKNETISPNEKSRTFDDYYHYPLSIAIIALAASMLLPTTTVKSNRNSKNLVKALVLSLITTSSVWSQDLSEELNLPSTFFDAKDYKAALTEYLSLYKEIKSPVDNLWEQGVLLYDAGTALLHDKKYEEALSKFQEADMLNLENPFFKMNLSINEALARLLNAKEKSVNVKSDQNATFEEYSEIFSLYRDLIETIEKADKAACSYAIAEGQKKCAQNARIKELQIEAKTLYYSFLKSYTAYSLKNMSIQEGVTELIAAANSIEDHLLTINSIVDEEKNASLKNKYLSFYKEQGDTFLPLWSSLEAAITSQVAATHHQEYSEYFKTAKNDYVSSLKEMENNRFEDSLKAIKQSKLNLKKLLVLDVKDETYKDAIERLLINYKLLFIQDPLQEASLSALKELQEILKKTFSLKGSKDLYEKADGLLGDSQKALKAYELKTARLFFEGAYFYVHKIAELLADSEGRLTPAKRLENSIKAEEILLTMTKLYDSSQNDNENRKENKNILEEIQLNIVKMADSFVENSIKQERLDFSTKAVCQCKPWDEVFPLFFKGQESLNHFDDLLKNAQLNDQTFNQLKGFQENTLKFWKEALQKLNSKQVENKKSKEDNKETKNSESQEPISSQTNQDNSNSKKELNDVLRFIQAMENDDKSAPSQVIFRGKEGELSW